MALLCVVIYIALISAFGCFVLRRLGIDQILLLPAGLTIGSMLIGIVMFILVSTGNISPISIMIVVIAISLVGALGMPALLRSLRAIKIFLYSHVYVGKYRVILTIVILVGLALYLTIAYCPPRSADAMRYHLAQLKDIIENGGFIYRPYYHYNFPQYFHYLLIPVFMVAGGTGMQLVVFLYFLLIILVTIYLSYKTEQTRHLLFLASFFIFMPVCTVSAVAVGSDLPVIFYVLTGFLLILAFGEHNKMWFLVLAYFSLGTAMGCKYQAILFFPLYMVATLSMMRQTGNYSLLKSVFTIMMLTLVSSFVALPFFVRNAYYTGDPIWPLLQDLFQVKKDYLYEVTNAYTSSIRGNLNFTTLGKSVARMVQDIRINPIIWLLCAGYYFMPPPRSGMLYKLGCAFYFCIWFLLQPVLYYRFAIYILPILAIMAITFCDWCYKKRAFVGKLLYSIVSLSIIGGLMFSVYQASGPIGFHLTRDLKYYHRVTWFYEQYQWMNEHLKNDGKILVIVSSGHTYYLDKPYLRADPRLTGLIDWNAVRNVKQLRDILHRLQVRYVFYDERDWSFAPGGSNMMHLIDQLRREKDVTILLKEDDVKLRGTVRRSNFQRTKVFLLQLPERFILHSSDH